MRINFGNSPEMEKIQYWFDYANQLCRNSSSCEDCPLVGYKPIKTDVSILRCETGKDRKPKGKQNDEGTGNENNRTDQSGDDKGSQ